MKNLLTTLAALALCAAALVFNPAHSQTPGGTPQPRVKFRRVVGTKRIAGQYIVVLKDTAAEAEAESARLSQAFPGERRHVYRHAIKGFSVRLSEAQAMRLAADPAVAFVEEDGVVTISTTQPGATWGLDRIDQRDLPLDGNYTYFFNGSGVKAYVLDTGVRATHGEFGGRVGPGFTVINDGQGTNDCHGHGTHVAGTVGSVTYGVAKNVSLVPVRVLDCNGVGSYSGVIAGVDWVTSDHAAGTPAVANMSLGGGASLALDTAVANSIGDGVTYVVAAGNSNADACNFSPARTPNAITVGATTSSDARASFSNFGTCLDIFAPGQNIKSTWHTSDTATGTLSGTSMAAPHVAGVAALHLQSHPLASPAAVTSAIITNSTPNKVTNPGAGSPNRLLYSLFEQGAKRRRDDLFLHRPGQGAAYVLRSDGNGTFTAVYAVGDNGPAAPNGIGGYDLLSVNDRTLSFDYNGDEREDLFLYRPGQGAAYVLRSDGNGTFTPVYAVGDNGAAQPNGIAGYDLLHPGDRALAFDYNGDGRDDLFLYRPGNGAAWVARSNGDGTFTAVYAVGDNGPAAPNGIAGYDLLSAGDRVLAFDYDGDGKDDLFLHRPGRGAAWVARSNGNGSFTAVYAVGDNGPTAPNGIGGYDLLLASDQVLVYDYNGDGRDDLFLYRPGNGAAWVAQSNGNGTFTAAYAVGDNGPAAPNGIGGYDLLSAADRVLVFDYDGDGKEDLFLHRPGQGAAYVVRSNGSGAFTPVYAVGDNGPAAPNGIGGYDLLSAKDSVVIFDYNKDGKDDLFLHRPGHGAAYVVRSNGNGTFTPVYSVGDNGPAAPNGIGGYDLLSANDRALAFDYNK